MKAIFIDSFCKEVVEITLPDDDTSLKECQKLLKGNLCLAHQVNMSNDLFVDDEGLFKEENCWFIFRGLTQPFKGNGLILGIDRGTGKTIDCTCSAKEIASHINFVKQLTLTHSLI